MLSWKLCGLKCCTQALVYLTCFVQILLVKDTEFTRFRGPKNVSTHTPLLPSPAENTVTHCNLKKNPKESHLFKEARKEKFD